MVEGLYQMFREVQKLRFGSGSRVRGCVIRVPETLVGGLMVG